jgi:hypothetical protein
MNALWGDDPKPDACFGCLVLLSHLALANEQHPLLQPTKNACSPLFWHLSMLLDSYEILTSNTQQYWQRPAIFEHLALLASFKFLACKAHLHRQFCLCHIQKKNSSRLNYNHEVTQQNKLSLNTLPRSTMLLRS